MSDRERQIEALAPIIEEMESRYPEHVIAARCIDALAPWLQARLNDEEQTVMDSILAAYNGILDMGLRGNSGELAAAVHVLQGFVVQHMLHRIAPQHWGSWFEPPTQEGER